MTDEEQMLLIITVSVMMNLILGFLLAWDIVILWGLQ